MKKTLQIFILITIVSSFFAVLVYAQMEGLHGDFANNASGLHEGNLFRTTFYNDGTWGVNQRPPDIGGEWPINSAHIYMLDGNTFVGSEVTDINGQTQHIVSEVRGPGSNNTTAYSTGDIGPDGNWRTFLPLPGFHNPHPPETESDQPKIAMNKWEWAWPAFWPDIKDPENPIYSPDGWAGSWNGYFGRDKQNADEESYFVSDDYANNEFAFYPDSTDSLRRGLGLRMYCRGFQWNNALVDDGLFALMDIKNIGTHEHDKLVYAFKVGNNVGETENNYANEGSDDAGQYLKEEDLAYLYDYDTSTKAPDWGPDPVGFFGGAFLESPGNPYDGIDNDYDASDGPGPEITEDLLESTTTLNLNSKIVLINYKTYQRKVMTLQDTLSALGSDTLIVQYQDQKYKYHVGDVIQERANDLVDNNLNGLIDENNGSLIGDPPIQKYLYIDETTGRGNKYIDYFADPETWDDNILIDERRDDGIDNDGDWNPTFDDVGADGLGPSDPGYPGPDTGEGDGLMTAGEPHFDKTDIDESDMLGLTGFTLYKWETMPHWADELVWEAATPGNFDDHYYNDNIELFFSSGYFPLKPDQTERFSMALMCGWDENDLIENKFWFARAYHENYNFSKAPNTPTVRAITGDNRVTLIWDSFAEESVDPITGPDFEGYAIYRSTDDQWSDMPTMTDYNGTPTQYRKPLAQFDLDNEYSGVCPLNVRGVHWNYGTNSGLVHTWTDTTALNGFTYFYAVTAYDHGDLDNAIAPSECTKSISRDPVTEKYRLGKNVVMVKPEAPSAGYVEADKDSVVHRNGNADGSVNATVVDADSVLNGVYRIVFEDTVTGNRDYPVTKNFSLLNVTDEDNIDTLINRSTAFHEGDEVPVIDGFQLTFNDLEITQLDYNPDPAVSGWNHANVDSPRVQVFNQSGKARVLESSDYMLIMGEVGIDTSTNWFRRSGERDPLPAIPVNFTILDTKANNKKIKFAFRERDMATDADAGKFTTRTAGSSSDEIIFLSDSLDEEGLNIAGWQLSLLRLPSDTTTTPAPGDTLTLGFFNPFLSNDVFEFTMHGKSVDNNLAKNQMDRIKVVPNPYIVTNSWEGHNPYATGRGPRVLHFIHLPSKCTIRIFNIRGQLVDTIEHETENLADGTAVWDMQTKDDLDIAYGVYIYHIDAPGIGNKIGKFAVIK